MRDLIRVLFSLFTLQLSMCINLNHPIYIYMLELHCLYGSCATRSSDCLQTMSATSSLNFLQGKSQHFPWQLYQFIVTSRTWMLYNQINIYIYYCFFFRCLASSFPAPSQPSLRSQCMLVNTLFESLVAEKERVVLKMSQEQQSFSQECGCGIKCGSITFIQVKMSTAHSWAKRRRKAPLKLKFASSPQSHILLGWMRTKPRQCDTTKYIL